MAETWLRQVKRLRLMAAAERDREPSYRPCRFDDWEADREAARQQHGQHDRRN